MDELELEILESLELIKEDQDANKKLKEDIDKVINCFKSEEDLKIEKSVLELEEINSYANSYLKTLIWDVISKLESLNSR